MPNFEIAIAASITVVQYLMNDLICLSDISTMSQSIAEILLLISSFYSYCCNYSKTLLRSLADIVGSSLTLTSSGTQMYYEFILSTVETLASNGLLNCPYIVYMNMTSEFIKLPQTRESIIQEQLILRQWTLHKALWTSHHAFEQMVLEFDWNLCGSQRLPLFFAWVHSNGCHSVTTTERLYNFKQRENHRRVLCSIKSVPQ